MGEKSEPPAALVDRVAEAIRRATVEEAKKRLAEQVLPIERIQRAFGVASAEADRSASILLFALAEDMMLDAFKQHLNGNVKGGWEAVTSANGLLATASDRLTLLELLYWIRPVTGSDLRLMKSIRNRFAHHAEVNSFEDRKIAGWITTMAAHESPALEALRESGMDVPTSWTLRELFLMRALAVIVGLAKDLVVGPIAMRERVPPSELSGGYDDQPQAFRDITLFLAGTFVDLTQKKLGTAAGG